MSKHVQALMATLASQERIRISDRTKAGLNRARRQGKRLGRPRIHVEMRKVEQLQGEGYSLRQIAKKTGWSLSSIMRAQRAA